MQAGVWRPLGEILVAQRWVSLEQLEAALRAQVIYGGRLGTNLVEAQAIDLDNLARGLSLQYGVPAALQKHFDLIRPPIIALVPPRLAEKHGAVPLGNPAGSPKVLGVALINPRQVSAIDEIAFATGLRIMPTVAPELRIFAALEKHYGVARKTRYVRLESKQLEADLQGDPEEPVPGVTLAVDVHAPLHLPPRPERRAQLDPLTGALVVAPASSAPRPSPPPERIAPPTPSPPPRPALALHDALGKVGAASSRDEIGQAVTDYLRSGFGAGLLFIARGEMALGWMGFGGGVDPSLIESFVLPLSAPSMLKIALERRGAFRGAPPPEGAELQGRLWKMLRCRPPSEVLVAPVLIKDRVVNLIYAHPPEGGTLSDSAIGELTALSASAATAFVRLIQSGKGKG